MAENKVQLQMSKVEEFGRCTRYAVWKDGADEEWDTIDVNNDALEKIGRPDVITVTIEAVSLQADAGS